MQTAASAQPARPTLKNPHGVPRLLKMTCTCAKFCKNSRRPNSFDATGAGTNPAAGPHELVMNLY